MAPIWASEAAGELLPMAGLSRWGRFAIGAALMLLPAADAPPTPSPPKAEALTMAGEVVELASALKGLGVPADPASTAGQVVLRTKDGSIAPLLSDEASRALFLDERLRNRRVEVSARRYPGLPYLQVLTFKVEHEGRLRTPEYYCDICTIHVRYPQICPCCQGDMELRMQPEAP